MTSDRARERHHWRALLLAAASLCVTSLADAQSVLDSLTPVTDAMLKNPPPQDWLTWRRTSDSWGYSPLKDVDTNNVGKLQLVWTRGLEPGPQEGTPLVHDGVMYFPNPRDIVQAIDVVTGDVLWEHRRQLPVDLEKFVNAPYINRSLAIHGNLIIDTSADGYVYALDARTGKPVWNVQVVDYHAGVHQTSGPLIVEGKVITGRGCEPLPDANPDACVIVAHDAATGRELWRTRTIPGPGEKGDETWGDIPFGERKHVGAWMTPSYDAELKLLYLGTSVTSPAPKYLLGGNDRKHLYHNCTLALDIATGKIVWYYQHVVDHWDLDHTFERILVDTVQAPAKDAVTWINPKLKSGELRKVITGIPGKTGIVYTLDRRTGEFLWARPTVQQNVVQSIDGRTGAVTVNPATQFHKKGDEVYVCPSIVGGRNWPAGAYSPLTDAMYFPLQNLCSTHTVIIDSRRENSSYGIRTQNSLSPGVTGVGSLQAISASTGRTLWKVEQRAAMLSTLTTAGGLVFAGDVAGRFRAYDQRNGTVLWEINLGAQVTGFPVTFSAQGRQYVAVSTGGAINTAAYLGMTPEIRPSNNSALYLFALSQDWRERPASAFTPVPSAAPLASAPPPAAAQCRNKDAVAKHVGLERATPVEGRRLYLQEQCTVCHGETLRGSASAPSLADAGFRAAWQGRPVSALLDCLRTTMPPGRGGALPDDTYLNLLSLLLDANGFEGRKRNASEGEILDVKR
ncbi:MAG: PQQ-binding-like beta-propeller repeat protein [Steroidobacteraceae bacterium]